MNTDFVRPVRIRVGDVLRLRLPETRRRAAYTAEVTVLSVEDKEELRQTGTASGRGAGFVRFTWNVSLALGSSDHPRHPFLLSLERRNGRPVCKVCRAAPCAAGLDNCGGPDCIPI